MFLKNQGFGKKPRVFENVKEKPRFREKTYKKIGFRFARITYMITYIIYIYTYYIHILYTWPISNNCDAKDMSCSQVGIDSIYGKRLK